MTKQEVHQVFIAYIVGGTALAFGGAWIFWAIYRWQKSIWRRERHFEPPAFSVNVREKSATDGTPDENPKL